MKTWREIRIEQTIKMHDPLLFLNKNYKGELQVMRESFKMVPHDIDGKTVLVKMPNHHYIMSLTEDWTGKTRPVDWGLEPIIKRIKEIDDWGSESSFERLLKENAKRDEIKSKRFASLTEDAVKEWRKDFKKHTSDILTHSVEKKDPRQKGDRKYGFGKSR